MPAILGLPSAKLPFSGRVRHNKFLAVSQCENMAAWTHILTGRYIMYKSNFPLDFADITY